jgi:RDD family protein
LSPQRRKRRADDEPLLFDLPLAAPGVEERRVTRGGAVQAVQSDLFAAEPEADEDDERGEESQSLLDLEAESAPEALSGPVIAGVGARLLAGCADALLHLGVVAGLYLGLIALDVEPRLGHWPALAVFVAAFSFLSSVVSLAFWGQTAGMAWRGLQTRDRLQRPLTFRQAALRWAGGLLTFATAGLPLLTALGGASLSDWMSRSVTYSVAEAPQR